MNIFDRVRLSGGARLNSITALHWHHHPEIGVGFVLSGNLRWKKSDRRARVGEALAETVQTTSIR